MSVNESIDVEYSSEMMGTQTDQNTSERYSWIEEMEADRQGDVREIAKAHAMIAIGLACWVGLILFGLFSCTSAVADDSGRLYVAAGVGYHNKTLDGPEFIMDNPLGILELEYQRGPWAFTLRHTSGMLVFEEGWGANVAEIKYRVTLF